MSVADIICGAMVERAKRENAAARLADAQRTVGTLALDIDFYSAADRKLPAEDYDFVDASGRHFRGVGSRWAVVKVRWNGAEWKRIRKLSGPLKFTDALTRCTSEAARLGLERRR